jgi:PTS system nitrogen regulatory IIA component
MSKNTITIEAILSPELTQCGLPGSSKKKVLQQIAQLVSKQYPQLEETTIFDNLIARERLGSTGVGQGIAIPHSRLENCHQVIGCLFTLEKKIPFDAIDNEDVDILFVLLVPLEATSEHLELLSQIAEKFNNPNFCEQLRLATTGQELYNQIIK